LRYGIELRTPSR